MFELRKNEIEDLRGRHLERALLEKVAERIWRFVRGNLQNAFVDREQHNARRFVRAIAKFDVLPRFHECGCLHSDRIASRIDIDRERLNTVGQRTRIDLR